MSYGPGGFPFSSKGGKEIHVSEFRFTIDGAATQARMPIDDARCLSGSAAAIFTQALIDAHLGTSSEFTAAQFDATSLGADAQGIIVDMGKQCDELIMMEGYCYSATGGATQSIVAVEDITTLQDSTLATECALGASGNVGIKIDWGNSPDFDGLTAGIVLIRVHWRSK
tara:strand:+ start:513 stop:1019 length:507 start_codon:yes stop_codon:yes gene_type:complete